MATRKVVSVKYSRNGNSFFSGVLDINPALSEDELRNLTYDLSRMQSDANGRYNGRMELTIREEEIVAESADSITTTEQPVEQAAEKAVHPDKQPTKKKAVKKPASAAKNSKNGKAKASKKKSGKQQKELL